MSLFPQLLRTAAEDLAREFIDKTPADILIGPLEHPAVVVSPIDGDRVSLLRVQEIRARVVVIATECGFPDSLKNEQLRAFDTRCAETLHLMMAISPAEAALDGIWAYLTCVVMPDIARWRFPSSDIGRLLGAWPKNTFRRLWWRAEWLRDEEGQDPYALLKALREDEVVSITERTTIGGSKRLAVGMAKGFLASQLESPATVRMQLMRDAARRIIRLRPFLAFETLEESELSTLIAEVFREGTARQDPKPSA